mmetsp:Transcript_1307/g.2597  ORF Transcript_1307/g.2597 Transcript_1307/m.2597 type:complete len:259 (-) Transcript_1307:367-1143(-)
MRPSNQIPWGTAGALKQNHGGCWRCVKPWTEGAASATSCKVHPMLSTFGQLSSKRCTFRSEEAYPLAIKDVVCQSSCSEMEGSCPSSRFSCAMKSRATQTVRKPFILTTSSRCSADTRSWPEGKMQSTSQIFCNASSSMANARYVVTLPRCRPNDRRAAAGVLGTPPSSPPPPRLILHHSTNSRHRVPTPGQFSVPNRCINSESEKVFSISFASSVPKSVVSVSIDAARGRRDSIQQNSSSETSPLTGGLMSFVKVLC